MNKQDFSSISFNFDKRIKKSLGQHYLTDKNILVKMKRIIYKNIEKQEGFKGNNFVEIASGLGAFTKYLVEDSKVIGIEIEKQSVSYLQEYFQSCLYNSFEALKRGEENGIWIINADIFDCDFNEEIPIDKSFSFVGNLPYNIASRLIIFLLEKYAYKISCMFFLIQKEVSEKFRANPGEKMYGFLSVIGQFFAEIKKEIEVSKHCFYPVPKVTSEFIQIKIKSELPFCKDYNFFKVFVKSAFHQRRKKIFKSLMTAPFYNFDEEKLSKTFANCSYKIRDERAENISWKSYLEVVNGYLSLED